MWASCAVALSLCACSGTTDVVGVLPTDVETGALEARPGGADLEGSTGVADGEGSVAGQFLIVAGMRVSWDGPALAWPFDVSLREFFAEEMSWSGRSGPPPRVERQVLEAMGRPAKPDRIRVVAPPPEMAERLREAFRREPHEASADVFVQEQADADDMAVRLMRDWRSDEYRVALGPASCSYAPSHHVGPCSELPADGFEHP